MKPKSTQAGMPVPLSFWLLASSLVILAGCGNVEQQRVEVTPGQPVPVQVATAASQDWPEVYEATGTVRARTTTVLSSKVMGYVQQVNAQAGDRVAEGQALVTLETRDLDANVRRVEAAGVEAQSAAPEVEHAIAAAKAQLDLAQTTLRRIQDLAAKKSVSNQELDEASARQKAAQANYDMAVSRRAQVQARVAQSETEQRAARITRDYAVISAPFAGVVTVRSVEPGSLAVPGAPLLTIERQGAYRFEASVEESKLTALRVGQRALVELEGCRVEAPVSEIVPAVDAASRSYIVKLELTCPAARSGMFGRAAFPLGTRKVIAIPAAAMTERGQLVSVFVVENGVARNRLITVGARTADSVEVLSGLNGGERVILAAPAALADGARVEVRQ